MRNLAQAPSNVKPVSKADQIRQLLHLPNNVIARRLGCMPEYVRAVRQRTSASGHPTHIASLKWREKNRAHYLAVQREYNRNRSVNRREASQ